MKTIIIGLFIMALIECQGQTRDEIVRRNAEKQIKENMHDPDSYEFVSLKLLKTTPSFYHYALRARGKNAFGAKVLGEYFVQVKVEGLEITDITSDARDLKTASNPVITNDVYMGIPEAPAKYIGKEDSNSMPEPEKEGAAVYNGRPGGGDGGTGLDLYGWEWDNIPKPVIPDNETGRIVFEIEVDENGELIRYRKESGNVSAAAERACVSSIQRLTFTKKPGAKVPEIAKGRITFVIRAR